MAARGGGAGGEGNGDGTLMYMGLLSEADDSVVEIHNGGSRATL